jgi:hypothetical protein
MDRILADPEGAQREVEETLRQLRQRYRQLQTSLNKSNRQRRRRPNAPAVVRDVKHDLSRQAPVFDSRKRTFDQAMQDTAADDWSSVSSSVSASFGGMSPTREELIALHVLGGDLQRASSSQDLPALEDNTEANEAAAAAANEESSAAPQEPENDQMMS